MKRIISITVLTCLLSFTSCQNAPDVENLETGARHIIDFREKGVQHNKEYSAYLFRFDSHNIIHAFFNRKTYTGKWSINSDYITDDEPFADSYLAINLKETPLKILMVTM